MGRLTVLIPTAGRPAMLRTALRSVAAQTARPEIAEVIVSENAGDPASGDVCREFPDLPISYRRREPPIPREQHLDLVLSETRTPMAALLFDDDWWAPDHLAWSIRRLEDHPEASASLGAGFNTWGEKEQPTVIESYLFWFGAKTPEYWGIWLLDRTAVAIASLGNTPGIYSSLVAPTAIFHRAVKTTGSLGNTFDTDRMLFFELSRHGRLLFDPMPRVFIRLHFAAHHRAFSVATRQEHLAKTTEWILDRCKEERIDLAMELAQRDRNAPPGTWLKMRFLFQPGPWAVLKRENLLPSDWKLQPPLPTSFAGKACWRLQRLFGERRVNRVR